MGFRLVFCICNTIKSVPGFPPIGTLFAKALHDCVHNDCENSLSKLAIPDELNASFDDPTGVNYPHAGKFRIIPISNNDPILQDISNEIPGGKEVRIVIKLSENFIEDIEMWRPLQIHLVHGGAQPTEYIILSGDTR